MRRAILALFLFLVGSVVGCGRPREGEGAEAAEADGLQITVSILPQRYFVEHVGGEHVRVNVLVKPGASPATYEPKPEQIRALSRADAYMSIGVPFEDAWLERIRAANPAMLMVDTAQGIERMEEGGHPDPHIWLSPRLVKVQAQTICDALVELDQANEEEYRTNLEAFQTEIDELDAYIRETLAGVENRKFMVFHPSWGYFARDYGLEMIPIEVGGQEPSAAELAAIIERAKAENIRVVFAQPEFSTRQAEVIAGEIGGQVVFLSALSPDWGNNLRRVAEILAEVLQ